MFWDCKLFCNKAEAQYRVNESLTDLLLLDHYLIHTCNTHKYIYIYIHRHTNIYSSICAFIETNLIVLELASETHVIVYQLAAIS